MAQLYCVDTSSLIKLKDFERDVFKSVWDVVEELIRTGQMFAPHEVHRELRVGDDDIHKWAKQQSGLFVDLDDEQAAALRELESRFSAVADPLRTGPHADPMVVPLALCRSRANRATPLHVVTEERARGPGPTKIPNICQAYGLSCTNLVGVFRLEGRVF